MWLMTERTDPGGAPRSRDGSWTDLARSRARRAPDNNQLVVKTEEDTDSDEQSKKRVIRVPAPDQGHVSLHGKQTPFWPLVPEQRNDWQWLGAARGGPTARRAAQVGLGSPSSEVQNSPGRQVWPPHGTPMSSRTTQRPLSHIAFAPAPGISAVHDWPTT